MLGYELSQILRQLNTKIKIFQNDKLFNKNKLF